MWQRSIAFIFAIFVRQADMPAQISVLAYNDERLMQQSQTWRIDRLLKSQLV